MPGPYIATSLGDGLAAGAGETKVFQTPRRKEVKNFLLLQSVPTSLRAPIESSETIKRVASRGGAAVEKFFFKKNRLTRKTEATTSPPPPLFGAGVEKRFS